MDNITAEDFTPVMELARKYGRLKTLTARGTSIDEKTIIKLTELGVRVITTDIKTSIARYYGDDQ